MEAEQQRRPAEKRWREWELHPPEEVYEASLCALAEFPAARKIKRAGSCDGFSPAARASQPMPFQQRTNTSCQLALPTHGFTVVLSAFRGTPPAKPLDCKIRFLISTAAVHGSGAHHTGDQPLLMVAKFNLPPDDITWMSFYACSKFFCLC
jgi:hypothetical protein